MDISKARILLVDDEPFILAATARVLRGAGHEVHTCEQWAGVANAVRLTEPDVVLMDYNMPAIKGDDLCAILKRNVITAGMKIVIYSSEPESDLIEITRRAGADGYIRKNEPAEMLLKRLEPYVGQCAHA